MTESLDPEAVSRVLRRAQELQEERAPIDDTRVSPEALVEAAEEVGIDADAVRDSLAIERLEVGSDTERSLDRLAGPAWVIVERVVDLDADRVVEAVEAWLTSAAHRRCDRRPDGSVVSIRRTDATARIRRTIAGLRGDASLGRVSTVIAEPARLTDGPSGGPRSVIRLAAERSGSRRTRLGGGAAIGVAGVAGGIVAAADVALALAPVAALPMLAGGYVVARSGSHHADRLELELERMLSAVGRGERPSGLLGRSVRRAARAVSTPNRSR